MRKLTKKRRLAIYKAALEVLKNPPPDWDACLCGAIWRVIKKQRYNEGCSIEPDPFGGLQTFYPEVWAYRPDATTGGYWWYPDEKGRLMRVAIMEEIITNMEPKRK